MDLIKKSVLSTDPNATVILYGSYARGDYNEESDIDLLVLLNKDNDKLAHEETDPIAFALYDIGVDTDMRISPVIYSQKGWANHKVTPYFENVNREGIIL